jgi:DNA-binding LytR/AlgR family response regulator
MLTGRWEEPNRMRIVVPRPDGVILLRPDEIDGVRAEGNYIILCTAQGDLKMRGVLKNFADRVRPCGFFRVHRNAAVRAEAITALVREESYRDAKIVVRCGAEFEIGRYYLKALRPLWRGGILDLEEVWNAEPKGRGPARSKLDELDEFADDREVPELKILQA